MNKFLTTVIVFLILSGCIAQHPIEEISISSPTIESSLANPIEPGKAYFRENDDLRFNITADAPAVVNGVWQVFLNIEALNTIKNLSVIFFSYPETVCQVELDSIEGLNIELPVYDPKAALRIDMTEGDHLILGYKLSDCQRRYDGHFLTIKAELMYNNMTSIFDELNLLVTDGKGSVYYYGTPIPTLPSDEFYPVLTPFTIYTLTSGYHLTPGLTQMPPSPTPVSTITPAPTKVITPKPYP